MYKTVELYKNTLQCRSNCFNVSEGLKQIKDSKFKKKIESSFHIDRTRCGIVAAESGTAFASR